MCRFLHIHHKWCDVPNVVVHDVFILFANPLGVAKIQYCERCGTIRLASIT